MTFAEMYILVCTSYLIKIVYEVGKPKGNPNPITWSGNPECERMSTGQRKWLKFTFTGNLKANVQVWWSRDIPAQEKWILKKWISYPLVTKPPNQCSIHPISVHFCPHFIADLCQERCYSTRYWLNDALILDVYISYFILKYSILFRVMLLLWGISFFYAFTGNV